MNRRSVLSAALALPLAPLALPLSVYAQPGCGMPTPDDVEGPFYRSGAPVRASLVEPGSRAEKLVLSGVVRSSECKPIAGVPLDFWHADAEGSYDSRGYRYRGVVSTDAQGRYRLETNLPPPYSGRPRHIHVKLQRPGGRLLTTQLYFPGESRGADPDLVVKIANRGMATFDFMLF